MPAEAAEQIVIKGMMFIDIKTTATFPYSAVPKNRRLRNGIVTTFPDCQKVEMAHIFGGMFDANVTRAFAGKHTPPHNHMATSGRINLYGNTMKNSREIRIVRIQKSHYFAAGSHKPPIQGIGLA
ncbi:hypothetical protein DSCA_09950 [Desulfosarcina alkanivorans]|uniref:Uncharacterized protein n=1 Tax=Desulfosarcina alkanivorans TaxID=571177 RepID=A0A5K7YF23_9BACT|nr:hypothetical protein DSCA_09950 [Desulfosarcina alkanivorans]